MSAATASAHAPALSGPLQVGHSPLILPMQLPNPPHVAATLAAAAVAAKNSGLAQQHQPPPPLQQQQPQTLQGHLQQQPTPQAPPLPQQHQRPFSDASASASGTPGHYKTVEAE
ncbi:hypothetical protein HK405_007838, partial [Cladochytrium tenue]